MVISHDIYTVPVRPGRGDAKGSSALPSRVLHSPRHAGGPSIPKRMATIDERNAEAMAIVNGSRLSRKEQGILADILFEWWTMSRREAMGSAKVRRRDGRKPSEIG